ncbi:MAG: hypothetical protein ABIR33_11380 [Pyrinomonadaceae bacterium]
MRCSICSNPNHQTILIDFASTRSLRRTADRFGVGYRSLSRHINECVYAAMRDAEHQRFEKALEAAVRRIRLIYAPSIRRVRRKSIISKPVLFTWSRRSWKR